MLLLAFATNLICRLVQLLTKCVVLKHISLALKPLVVCQCCSRKHFMNLQALPQPANPLLGNLQNIRIVNNGQALSENFGTNPVCDEVTEKIDVKH
jgi:hypothetical protein